MSSPLDSRKGSALIDYNTDMLGLHMISLSSSPTQWAEHYVIVGHILAIKYHGNKPCESLLI